MPAATQRKKHIFCHIAMSVKFRSCVCLCVCVFVCVCACLRFKGTFIIKFHFLCRQTLLPAGWQTRGNERANECVRVCVCVCVCGCACVCVCVGYSGQTLGCTGSCVAFIFICLFFPSHSGGEHHWSDTGIGFFSYFKMAVEGFYMSQTLTHIHEPHTHTHTQMCSNR